MKRDPNCQLCSLHETAEFVCLIGKGPEPARAMVIGEAPGRREDASGKPFVGSSGALLDRLFNEVGLDRKEMFVTNAVLCRPPDNRTPKRKEIEACNKWLKYQISKVKPEFILALGNVALQSLTGEGGIKKKRGKPFEKDGMTILPTYHPSFALRDERQIHVLKQDIQSFKDIIDFGGIPEERDLNYSIIDTISKLKAILPKLYGSVSYDLETTGLYPWAPDFKIVSLILGIADEQFVIPLNHHLFTQSKQDEMWDLLLPILDECDLVGHNMKFDVLCTWVVTGHRLRIGFDTMLAHYILNENSRHDLEHLAAVYFGAPHYDVPLAVKQGKEGSLEQHCKYGASDGFYTRKLKFKLLAELKRDLLVKRVFDKLMMPVTNLFCRIEMNGVYINEAKMGDAEKYLKSEIAAAQVEWEKYGEGVNMASPQQVGELFFKKLKITPLDKTAKGANSTSESVMKRIDHPAARALLRFRGAKQQHSFFIEGWRPYIHRSRIHPSFKLHGTVTGRLSCEHPNFQQVPRDKRIRSLISAPPGWTFLEADLSQIELRVVAELAQEPEMLKAFHDGVDIHWLTAIREIERSAGLKDLVCDTAKTARQVKEIRYAEAIKTLLEIGPDVAAEINEEWKELRKKAKAVNFGYVFGMWWKKFKIYARDNYGFSLTDKEAQQSRITFFDMYNLEDWHKHQQRTARLNGFVKSLTGRKRRLPEAMIGEDTPQRAEALRQAINSPVQSFANDLNLMTLLQMSEEFPQTVFRPVMTVHDMVGAEVKNEHLVEVVERIEVMSRVLIENVVSEHRVKADAQAMPCDYPSAQDIKFHIVPNEVALVEDRE